MDDRKREREGDREQRAVGDRIREKVTECWLFYVILCCVRDTLFAFIINNMQFTFLPFPSVGMLLFNFVFLVENSV